MVFLISFRTIISKWVNCISWIIDIYFENRTTSKKLKFLRTNETKNVSRGKSSFDKINFVLTWHSRYRPSILPVPERNYDYFESIIINNPINVHWLITKYTNNTTCWVINFVPSFCSIKGQFLFHWLPRLSIQYISDIIFLKL